IPGRTDVPVIVNPLGFDASFTVVEGDFGLGQPVQVNPRIVGGFPQPPLLGPRAHYFPPTGQQPGYGRYEVAPLRRGPQTAQSYNRSWFTASDPTPASSDPPTPMVIQPFVGGGWGGPGPRR